MQVLIVEDDAELAAAIADYLSLFEVECDFAYSGSAGLEMARRGNFEIIILDLMLPRMNGFSVCQTLRDQGYNTPVLMLTACDTDADQLEGFLAGVDDYVTKPCAMPVLWARLQAIYRRNNPASDTLTIGPLKLDLRSEKASRSNQPLRLSPISWQILELLARHSPEIVPRKTIEQHVWPDGQVDSGNFNVQLHMLRKVVDHPFESVLIHTYTGKGLCLKDVPE
ncbi:response regulator transcription factor [Aliamphritea hakodatensis]|uniref:response regulator transcription factor n=1 Tax=Aliamphritea hakodatensis TaxID=2895352 RepID=UPI0022FD7220|nr:response regulator transcription factor [Aliamphritea hakodatensis]